MNQNIKGGVTPLKARKSAGKAGKVGKKATKYNPGSGLSVSDTIDTGKGYKANLESLTDSMRTQESLAAALGAKGPGGQPTKKDDFGGSSTFEETDGLSPEREERTITEEGKSGNRFYDACHNADGSRKAVGSVGTTTWVDENGETQSKSFECKWGGPASGRHNYTDEKSSKDQFRERESKDSDWGPWQDK